MQNISEERSEIFRLAELVFGKVGFIEIAGLTVESYVDELIVSFKRNNGFITRPVNK